MAFRLVQCPSPNHDDRPAGAPIDMLVLHYTGMQTADAALARLCDPKAKVSAHYTVDRQGCVYAHVGEERRAWHAGLSFWAGETNINGRSIGIELVNPGHEFGYEPFADRQIAALIELSSAILARHPIPAHRVLGHSDVAPSRKTDPGELFPWAGLARAGIGLWPQPAAEDAACSTGDAIAGLARFGYGLPPDVPAEAAIMAFQRHFRPSKIDGVMDGECAALVSALLRSLP
jgi:Negative regulator of beta-lactamase expression